LTNERVELQRAGGCASRACTEYASLDQAEISISTCDMKLFLFWKDVNPYPPGVFEDAKLKQALKNCTEFQVSPKGVCFKQQVSKDMTG